MIISFILGIFFTVFGFYRRKYNAIYKLSIVLGILFLIFAVYLAMPH